MRLSRRGLHFCALWLFVVSSLSVFAIDFSITQIADERLNNREPVISETGLACWPAYSENEQNVMLCQLFVFQNGKAEAISKEFLKPDAATIKPVAQSNVLVWVGTFSEPPDTIDWALREVPEPDRDEPVKELSGRMILRVDETGRQEWLPLAGTNALAATDTNAVPGSSTDTNTVVTSTDTNIPPEIKDESRRSDFGDTEICRWTSNELRRITHDRRDDLGPSIWGDLIAWQKGKGWPFGWEIMIWSAGEQIQLTTNFHYDMAPKVQNNQVVWYGWDGHDFEIFLYDHTNATTIQITSNQFDDVSPVLWDGVIAWEGYPGVDADIFIWKDNKIQKLSDNIEDDVNPSIFNGQVVWQGFDGDDFEIYLFDGTKTIKLTSNMYDDLNPEIRDGLICWMGYHDNWDSEIFVWDGNEAKRMTDDDFEDRDPRTAGGRVIWLSDHEGKSHIYLAEPK